MAKHSRSRPRRKSPYLSQSPSTSDPEFTYSGTLGSGTTASDVFLDRKYPDATSAPTIGEQDEEDTYSQEAPELIEKFLRGRVVFQPKSVFLVVTLVWFGIISWLFVRDNELGRLSSFNDIRWFAIKTGIYTSFYIIVTVIVGLSSRASRTKRKSV